MFTAGSVKDVHKYQGILGGTSSRAHLQMCGITFVIHETKKMAENYMNIQEVVHPDLNIQLNIQICSVMRSKGTTVF